MNPLLDFAIIATAVAALIPVLRHLDRRAQRDSLRLHAEQMQALAPVVQLAPRPRPMSSIEFLYGRQQRGSSWSRAEGPTPTAGTGLAAVGEYAKATDVGRALPELIAGSAGHASPRRAQQGAPRPPRHLRSAPDGAA